MAGIRYFENRGVAISQLTIELSYRQQIARQLRTLR